MDYSFLKQAGHLSPPDLGQGAASFTNQNSAIKHVIWCYSWGGRFTPPGRLAPLSPTVRVVTSDAMTFAFSRWQHNSVNSQSLYMHTHIKMFENERCLHGVVVSEREVRAGGPAFEPRLV